MCVAIDFTGSEGLHYLNAINQYEQAIASVVQILEPYDTDKAIPVYGLGGVPKFTGSTQVNHCYPLNGNMQNPAVIGTQGILYLYRA